MHLLITMQCEWNFKKEVLVPVRALNEKQWLLRTVEMHTQRLKLYSMLPKCKSKKSHV